MVTEKDVKQFWAESTQEYLLEKPTGIDISRRQDGYWKYLDIWEKQVVLTHLAKGKILDLGCGTGRISQFLFARGKTVVPVDYVPECLDVLKRATPALTCAGMSATALALKEVSFDCVVSCRVLQSLPTVEAKGLALSEIHRVLKTGGTLILTEGNPLRQRFVPVPYNFYMSLSEWKRLLRTSGFLVEKTYGIPLLTASKLLDRVMLGALHRINFPFRAANILDRICGPLIPAFVSLQYDIIAKKI